jgi:class 3 adenylate cyclase
VTVFFCDLVDFTAHSERLDPEKVRAIQGPFYRRVRAELERYGGTVEKFIGDAVMALFGAPIAHEDDPERAVRAALAIRDWTAEHGELQVRIAITTGEALVHLEAKPLAGEGMASGDVVNTAARLQAAAPENGVVVDEATYRATDDVVEYWEAKPIAAKGKAEPVGVWQAVRTLAPIRPAREPRAPFVGRAHELAIMRDAFAGALAERSIRLVTLVGVPGIGKSRLVHEFLNDAEHAGTSVTWLQGRSLPYGAGVTLWALGEIVKAHASILESDGEVEAEEKLRRAVTETLGKTKDADWVHGHLRPLIVPPSDGETRGDRRAESFAAWRRFMEALAGQLPLVLVLEDVHWADDTLLDFVEYLVEWASEAPLLVLATTRPELLDRRPAWAASKPGVETVMLAPLSDEETTRLIAALLERPAARGRDSSNPAHASIWQSPLRRGVRSPARDSRTRWRTGHSARDGAGNHCSADRRALGRGEDPPPRRGGHRQGVLERCRRWLDRA